MRLILIPMMLLLSSCPSPECDFLSTRCEGEVSQICDSSRTWITAANCSAISPGVWTCSYGECINDTTP